MSFALARTYPPAGKGSWDGWRCVLNQGMGSAMARVGSDRIPAVHPACASLRRRRLTECWNSSEARDAYIAGPAMSSDQNRVSLPAQFLLKLGTEKVDAVEHVMEVLLSSDLMRGGFPGYLGMMAGTAKNAMLSY